MKVKMLAIEHHGERIYRGIQFLLVAAATSAIYVLMVADRGALAGWLALVSLVATSTGILSLFYLRRSLAFRLKSAWLAEQERFELVSADPLTTAFQRRFFLDALREALGRPSRPEEVVLLLIDLDHFKRLNDSLGHQCGDAALRYLVVAIRTILPGGTVGRLGGDEFGVFLPTADLPDATWRAGRLVEMLRAGMTFEGKQIPLSASMGIAAAPQHAGDVDGLIGHADLALYESKRNGRSRATVFDMEMLADRRHHRFLERELRAAVFLDELEVHYQPIADKDGGWFAVEALVRWRHATRGMIAPSEFIPVAEQSNLIDLVGAWVFRRACLDARALPVPRISINVSAEQLKREDLVAMFTRVLKETGQAAERFVLEITETAAMAATGEVIERLRRLRDMGFRIALDDFGTGHCGFNYLRTLPINSIKIDGSYVRSLGSDEVARVFVTALTQIARVLDATIVAEGVETAEELVLARTVGCDRFQGYLIGRPMPLAALLKATPAASEADAA